ncbi:MAG: hypothetical protein AB7P35_17710 [Hyphomonadaceae bacterium]
MTDRFYSVNLGEETEAGVTEGGSTTAGDSIEVRVTYDATGMNKHAVLRGLDAIERYILRDTFPPA